MYIYIWWSIYRIYLDAMLNDGFVGNFRGLVTLNPGCFHGTPHVARQLWHNVGDALPLRVAQSVSFEDSSTPWWEVDGCESVGLQFQSKSLGMTLWYFKVVRGVLNYTWIPVASQIWVLWMLVLRNQLKSFRSRSDISDESWAIPKWIQQCKEQLKEREVDNFPHQRKSTIFNMQYQAPYLWTQTRMLPGIFKWMVHLNTFASASCNHRRCSCNCHNLGKPGWSTRRNHSFSSCRHKGGEAMTLKRICHHMS